MSRRAPLVAGATSPRPPARRALALSVRLSQTQEPPAGIFLAQRSLRFAQG